MRGFLLQMRFNWTTTCSHRVTSIRTWIMTSDESITLKVLPKYVYFVPSASQLQVTRFASVVFFNFSRGGMFHRHSWLQRPGPILPNFVLKVSDVYVEICCQKVSEKVSDSRRLIRFSLAESWSKLRGSLLRRSKTWYGSLTRLPISVRKFSSSVWPMTRVLPTNGDPVGHGQQACQGVDFMNLASWTIRPCVFF